MKSLSSKLIAIMLVISIFGMLLIAGSAVYIIRDTLLNESLGRVNQTTNNAAARVNSWLTKQNEHIISFAIELGYDDDYSEENLLPRLNAHMDSEDVYSDVFVGFPDGTVTLASGADMDYDGGWDATERPWYKGAMENTNIASITDPYIDSQTGELCITASKAIVKSDGRVVGVAGIDILLTDLEVIIERYMINTDALAYLISDKGDILVDSHPEHKPANDGTMFNVDTIEDGHFKPVWEALQNNETPYEYKNANRISSYYSASKIDSTGWYLCTEVNKGMIDAPIVQQIVTALTIMLLVIIFAIIFIYKTLKNIIIRPISNLGRGIDSIREGNMDFELRDTKNDELGQLITSFNRMANRMKEQAATTIDIANGDLTVDIPTASEKDIIGQALIKLKDVLVEFVEAITETAHALEEGSSDIALSSNSVSLGATQQKEAVQELTLAMAGISSQVRETEKRSSDARSLMRENIGANVRIGAEKMNEMIHANREINLASENISGIIKMIDDIAFQTNILALNATVEAARAGEHGKGFAVVADEVRILAQKSAQAAEEITTIIEEMIAKAESGVIMANETNEIFTKTFSGIEETTDIAVEVNEAAIKQLAEIMVINRQIDDVYEIVKVNDSNAGHLADASHELSEKASELTEIVNKFKTKEKADTGEKGIESDN